MVLKSTNSDSEDELLCTPTKWRQEFISQNFKKEI